MMTPTGASYSASRDQGRSLVEMNNHRLENDDILHLEKANFDLKMKLFYLENSGGRDSSRVAMLDGGGDTFPHVSRTQPTRLINILDEKSLELEQRNQLLIRAKLAIEALKQELEKLRVDSRKHSYDLEKQLRHSKLENDEISYKYHASALAFESEISKANSSIANKEHLRAAAEEKLVSYHML